MNTSATGANTTSHRARAHVLGRFLYRWLFTIIWVTVVALATWLVWCRN